VANLRTHNVHYYGDGVSLYEMHWSSTLYLNNTTEQRNISIISDGEQRELFFQSRMEEGNLKFICGVVVCWNLIVCWCMGFC